MCDTENDRLAACIVKRLTIRGLRAAARPIGALPHGGTGGRLWRCVFRSASAGGVTALDVFVFLLLIGGAAIGFVRGFVHEVLSLFAWIVAVAMLKLFHSQLWTGIEGSFRVSHPAAAVLAFAILFVPSFVLVKLLARQLGGRTRRHSVLGPFDRVLGGGFGALKGLLGATLFFLLANLATDMVYGTAAERPGWMRKSSTYPLLNAGGRAIVDWVEARRLHVKKVGEGA